VIHTRSDNDVNIVLFRKEELGRPLPLYDHRARHIIRVLKCGVGDSFDGGIAGGFRGKVRITAILDEGLELEFALSTPPDTLLPVTLIVGLCRPQTVRKVLREAGAIGVSRIVFVPTEKSESSYAHSKIWTNGEVPACLLEGTGQAFSTAIPDVVLAQGFTSAVRTIARTGKKPTGIDAGSAAGGFDECVAPAEQIPSVGIGTNDGPLRLFPATLFALDNYAATCPLREAPLSFDSAVLAVGPERGWSDGERSILREEGFTLARIGGRVLRVETACTVGLALVLAKMDLI
jgi:16S rRNA (uracil1498-N3)-methyltransferase